jgi:hypothetical protein
MDDKILIFEVEQCSGGKKSDGTFTGKFGCNADGLEKLPIFVTRKS